MSRSASRCEASGVVTSFPFLSEPAGVMRSGALRTALRRDETAGALLPWPRISTPAAAIALFAAGRSPAGSRGGLNMHSTASYETTPETAAFPPLPHNKRDAQCVQGPLRACLQHGPRGASPPAQPWERPPGMFSDPALAAASNEMFEDVEPHRARPMPGRFPGERRMHAGCRKRERPVGFTNGRSRVRRVRGASTSNREGSRRLSRDPDRGCRAAV